MAQVKAKARKKKTDTSILNVALIWDMSGSMGSVWYSAIEGANDYIHKLRDDPTVENMRFSVTVFDTVFERWHEDVMIDEIPIFTDASYAPRGMTALNDAVADAIVSLDERLKEERADERVLIVVLTDGEENSSKEYGGPEGTARLAELIRNKEKTGKWTFVYLGAGSPDQVVATATAYNIPAGNAASYAATHKGTGQTFAMASVVTSTLSGATGPSGSRGSTGEAFRDAGFKSALEQKSEEDQN